MRFSLTIIMALILGSSFAQNVSFEAYLQESRLGVQKGYGIHFMNKSGWGTGLVFQSTRNFSNELSDNNYPFVGMEVRVPIQTCNRLTLQFAPKIGFVNRDFLVFLPEIQTEYAITNNVGIGVGAGIRVREAAVSLKAFYRPFKKK